ncbi:MAG: DinB family protein [Phycisphaerae bacterium]|nr:DinB family protein [Phycisphaerae bacterium]
MAKPTHSDWHEAFHWGFGRGFWYMDPLDETKDLAPDELLWSPMPGIHCALWHVGHIAHRERFHIAVLLEGRPEDEVIPARFGIFGCGIGFPSADMLLEAVGSVEDVKAWVREVRRQSHAFIDSLDEKDFNRLPASSFEGNSIARVLMQTIGHTGVHIGRIQLLRAMMKNGAARE